MKKGFWMIALLIVLAVVVYAVASYTAPSDIASAVINSEGSDNHSAEGSNAVVLAGSEGVLVNQELSSFGFEGFSVGKSHEGVFDDFSAELFFDDDGGLVGASGTVQASSVNTGISKLDDHLRSDDFFDVTNHQGMSFVSSSFSDDKTTLSGTLTFLGVSEQISFPVSVSDSSVEADFLLDTTPFGMKYTGVNPEVRIFFVMSA